MESVTIARPYAIAIYEIAVQSQSLQKWSKLLASLSDVFSQRQLCQAITAPSLTPKQQVELLAVEGLDKEGEEHRFIQALAENKRLALLPDIAMVFEQKKLAWEKISQVELICARPMAKTQQEQVASAIAKHVGQEIKLEYSEDSSLIGGAVIRVGDQVIDGSIRGRLKKLAYAIKF